MARSTAVRLDEAPVLLVRRAPGEEELVGPASDPPLPPSVGLLEAEKHRPQAGIGGIHTNDLVPGHDGLDAVVDVVEDGNQPLVESLFRSPEYPEKGSGRPGPKCPNALFLGSAKLAVSRPRGRGDRWVYCPFGRRS